MHLHINSIRLCCLDICHCVIGFALYVSPIRSASFSFCLCCDSHYQHTVFVRILTVLEVGTPLRAFQTGELLLPHPYLFTTLLFQSNTFFHSLWISKKPCDLCPVLERPPQESPHSPGIVLRATPSDWHGPHSCSLLSFCNSL